MIFISKLPLFLTLFLLPLMANDLSRLKKEKIYFQFGEAISVYLAESSGDQELGLSHVQDKNLEENGGMLFIYRELSPRRFWMPHTYFNLDLFFFDKEKRVTAIHRDLKASELNKGRPVDETATHLAMYVLELKSSSPFAKRIKIGDSFDFLKTISSQKNP